MLAGSADILKMLYDIFQGKGEDNMYLLMNKDNPICQFALSDGLIEPKFEILEQAGKMPFGFRDINAWLENRKAYNHNQHLAVVMERYHCYTTKEFIERTHACSINDTFWVKTDRESISWNDVSLYRNEFSKVISELAFEGKGLYDEVFSPTNPELTADGSYRKCFRRGGKTIVLYKRGLDFEGAPDGLEPYCEVMASEIARIICPNAVRYNLAEINGITASRCEIFTNETVGLASFVKIDPEHARDINQIFREYQKYGSEDIFRRMILLDSVVFNGDRHAGNFGFLFNNDTLELIQMAPVYDLNQALFPYKSIQELKSPENIKFGTPKLGSDYTAVAHRILTDKIREDLKLIRDFEFSFRGDDRFPEAKVRAIEAIVQKQAAAILKPQLVYTKDVFIPSHKDLGWEPADGPITDSFFDD